MADRLPLTLLDIQRKLAHYTPQRLPDCDHRRAAVAMLLREQRDVAEMLLIERARNPRDPWSGQMGFPGGMLEYKDASARAAAQRETQEEIGLSLGGSSCMGRLDDLQGRHRGHVQGIIVSAFLYAVRRSFDPCPNYEVRDVVWIPMSRFFDDNRVVQVGHPLAPAERFPGIRVTDNPEQIVWGLTHRFIGSLFRVLGLDWASG